MAILKYEGTTYAEAIAYLKSIDPKMLVRFEFCCEEHFDDEYDVLDDLTAKRMARSAFDMVKRCNTYLDDEHDEGNVLHFVVKEFRKDMSKAVKKMSGCGKNKFVSQLVARMSAKGWYGDTPVDTLAIELGLEYKGAHNWHNTRRYIFDEKEELNEK